MIMRTLVRWLACCLALSCWVGGAQSATPHVAKSRDFDPVEAANQLTVGTAVASGTCLFAWSVELGGYRSCGNRFSVVTSQPLNQPYFVFGVIGEPEPLIFMTQRNSKTVREGEAVWRLEPLSAQDIASTQRTSSNKGTAPSAYADGECSISHRSIVRCVTWKNMERTAVSQEVIFKLDAVLQPQSRSW